MKDFTITDQRRDRLITMCREVYPRKDVSMFHNGWEYDVDKEFVDISSKSMNVTIHWLELCMGDLLEELYNKVSETLNDDCEDLLEQFSTNGSTLDVDDILCQMVYNMETTHPIDFLWEELYIKYLKK